MKQLSQQLSQEKLEKATLELQAQTLQGLKQTCTDQEKELDALKLSVKVRLTCAARIPAPDSSVDRAPDEKFRGHELDCRSGPSLFLPSRYSINVAIRINTDTLATL